MGKTTVRPSGPARIPLERRAAGCNLHRLFAQPWRLAQALLWQFAGYLVGALETWFALTLLGHPVSLEAALAIEALTQAIRHATFIVPGGLGIQEAGVVLFGHLAGVSGEAALALALVKRAREVLFGLPALLSWQWVEARVVRQARSAQTPGLS